MLKLESIPSEIRKETSKDKKLPACIPKPMPMAWVILGAVGSGKSSMLWSMINPTNGWFKKYFNKIVVWQSTIDSNSTWEKIPNTEVINEYDEEFLRSYYKQIQEQQQALRDARRKIHNYLFVFDDMITQGIVSHHRISVIDHIFQTYRHANVSIVVCSQMYHQLNKTTRSLNLSALVVLKVNKKEIEDVAAEHSGLLSEEEFIKMYHKIMEQKRGYLFIDYKAGLKERFRDTINDVIEISE